MASEQLQCAACKGSMAQEAVHFCKECSGSLHSVVMCKAVWMQLYYSQAQSLLVLIQQQYARRRPCFCDIGKSQVRVSD